MYRIAKRFEFSAAHALGHLPAEHPCARLHGHNYVVEIVLESRVLDDRGFCGVDYRELDEFKRWIDLSLDHRNLNDVMLTVTTAENIAKLLFTKAREISGLVVAARVSETPKTWAEYRE